MSHVSALSVPGCSTCGMQRRRESRGKGASHLHLLVLLFLAFAACSAHAYMGYPRPLSDEVRQSFRQYQLTPLPAVGTCRELSSERRIKSTKAAAVKLQWVHFPKTGSSLATTLYHLACDLPEEAVPSLPPDKPFGAVSVHFEVVFPFKSHCNHGKLKWIETRSGHSPFREAKGQDAASLVMMVRDPRKRLRSAYNYGLHANGIGDSKLLRASVHSIRDFVDYPGIKHCMVKMLTNGKCAAPERVDEHRLQLAIDTLRKAAFVGLTDEWNDSICLLHAMFGGKVNAHSFRNVRSTDEVWSGHSKVSEDDISPEDDPYDWQLYLVAKAVFRERQKKFGLPVYEEPDER